MTNSSLILPTYSENKASIRLEACQNQDSSKYNIRYFQIITRHLYREDFEGKGELGLYVKNLSDGFGDHMHGKNCYEALQKKFPELSLSQTTVFSRGSTPPVYLAKPAEFFPIMWDGEYKENEVNSIEKRANQSACLHISTPIWEFCYGEKGEEVLQKIQDTPSTVIREYGNGSKCINHYKELSMGLAADEEGILLPKIPKKNLSDVKNLFLSSFFDPQYLEDHHLHVGYIKTTRFFQAAFIYMCSSIHQEDQKGVDIILPLDCSYAFLEKHGILQKQYLQEAKVKTVEIHQEGKDKELIPIQEEGKVIRIINPGFISQDDYYALLQTSEHPFGCTGDVSISECIAAKKLPFYELRKIKLPFFQDLIQIAQSHNLPLMVSYFESIRSLYEENDEILYRQDQYTYEDNQPYLELFIPTMQNKIKTSLPILISLFQNPLFLNQWDTLDQIIVDSYNFLDHLYDIAARELMVFAHKDLLEKEKELFTSYSKEKITPQQVQAILSSSIKEKLILPIDHPLAIQ